ncbi:interleukin-10 receptor subunit alpha isoform X1 [Ranitomeya variabilis]|uniref:interleukin-10 receptor subunit alpha isoform X1 n=1 Tax=Ranitomeya variabilis TaxID=490064 RepID=UPI004055AB7B
MAKLGLSVLRCVAFLNAAVCPLSPSKGENPTSPTNVNFQNDFFHHVLIWDHHKPNDGILYEIQYKSYGSNWNSVSHCHFISHRYCDLTAETLPKSLGYFGRVRSVLGNQTSKWTQSTRYKFEDVNLPPPSVALAVNGSSIHVELTLARVTKNNITRDYKDVFPYHRIYKVQIRRTRDNHTVQHLKNEESFSIPNLPWSNEYCLSVEPAIASRQNLGEASSEICIYLPEEGLASTTLLVLAACILSFLVLLISVNFFICLYVRGVVKTPKTLKSLIQRSWSWMDKPPSPIIETMLCWETSLKDHLMAKPRDSPMRSSADSGFGSQQFIHMLKPSPTFLQNSPDKVHDPKTNSNVIEVYVQEEIPDKSLQEEDSGISLSTGSPTLKRTNSYIDTPYRGNPQSFVEKMEVNVSLGYLKQLEPENKPDSFEDPELENTCKPQIKDYLSQRPDDLCKTITDSDIFQETWVPVPETLQTPIPLTVAFSPFSRVLWELGVSAPSLGDVELLDTSS